MADELSTAPLAAQLASRAAAELSGANVVQHKASMPFAGIENGARVSRRPTTATPVRPPPPPTPPSLAQDEEAVTAADTDRLHHAQAKANLEAGGIAVVFGFAVLTAWLCLPSEAKHPSNMRFTVSLLLAFGTFVSGNCLMFLSMNMIGLRRQLVTGVQHGASRWLFFVCAALSTMTLVSLLALLPGRVYLCLVGLAMLASVAMPIAAAYWYFTRHAHGVGGDGEEAAAAAAPPPEYREEMEAAWKTTTGVTNSAFGGLVGVLSGASMVSDASSRTLATYVAVFFMFSAAMIGMFVMTVSKRAVDVTNQRILRGASSVVIGTVMAAAFVPLAITALLYLLLRHCTPGRGGARPGALTEEQEARLKATEDIASKVTATTLGAIMSVLGGSLAEEADRKAGPVDAVMVILTSAFVSGCGFMLLASMPAGSSARARLAPVARVLAWSSMAMFVGTAVAVYGAQAWRI
uniref:Uncharacterized protein n=1 Tax=Oryza brachyantha TaxID=4533 RepID=J3MF90_ORYBR